MGNWFDIDQFRSNVSDILNKKSESPYRRDAWISSGMLAKECGVRLSRIASQLDLLMPEVSCADRLHTKISCGMGYFPKTPWIGLLADDEKVSNGVFLIVCFDANGRGFFIGCGDSIARPQYGFDRECYTDEELAHPENIKNAEYIPYDKHLARDAVWYSREQINNITKDDLLDALKAADTVRLRVRGQSSMQYVQGGSSVHKNNVPRWVKPINVCDMYRWLEFIERCSQGRRFIFRGQGNASWELKSSLERLLQYEGRSLEKSECEKIVSKERKALERFKTISAQKLGYRQLEAIDLLSLMQHYGGKTRLLDFTRSPLIALYMAMDHYRQGELERAQVLDQDCPMNERDFAVWAIDRECLTLAGADLITLMDINGCIAESDDRSQLQKPMGKDVYLVEPSVMNARMAAQEGLFVMSNNIAEPLMTTLGERVEGSNKFNVNKFNIDNTPDTINSSHMPSTNSMACVYKYVFGNKMIAEAMAMLDHLCITPRVVYPDLVGMAKDATFILERMAED